MPSRFTEWCDALVARLAESSFGTAEYTAVNTLEELAAAFLKTRASHLVACSRQPAVRLQTEIVHGKRPFLVTIGDPRAALRNLLERAGYDVVSATRAVASSCAAMLSLTRAPGPLVVSSGAVTDSMAVANAIADHFELSTSRSEVAAIVLALSEAGVTPDHGDDSAWWNELGEREQAIVNGALLPYVSHLTPDAELEPLVWEPELFFINDDPPAPMPIPASRPVDITGRVRFLVYGPFINPPHTRVEPPAEQIIEANLHFVIDDSVDQPVQIRVFNERAAFDGRLALGYVTMMPQAAIPSETRDRLAAILR